MITLGIILLLSEIPLVVFAYYLYKKEHAQQAETSTYKHVIYYDCLFYLETDERDEIALYINLLEDGHAYISADYNTLPTNETEAREALAGNWYDMDTQEPAELDAVA